MEFNLFYKSNTDYIHIVFTRQFSSLFAKGIYLYSIPKSLIDVNHS